MSGVVFGQNGTFDVTSVLPNNPILYTGQRFDAETCLDYYKNRYYSAVQGSFLGRDPIGFGGEINLYRYSASQPTSATDPTGLKFVTNEDEFYKLLIQRGVMKEADAKAVLDAMRNDPNFKLLRDFLANSPMKIELTVVPGLTVPGHGERSGATTPPENYERSKITIGVPEEIQMNIDHTPLKIEINPNDPSYQGNPLELVDTIVHEMVHAYLYDVEARGRHIDPEKCPLLSNSKHSPNDKRFGKNMEALAGKAKELGTTVEELKKHMDKNYARYPESQDYIDINYSGLGFISQISSSISAKTNIGKPTRHNIVSGKFLQEQKK